MMILASQSPRRKELIRKLVDDFIVIPADIDENVKNSKNWVIFANKNFFNKNKIKEYRDIKIIYNNFIQNNTLAILHKNGI